MSSDVVQMTQDTYVGPKLSEYKGFIVAQQRIVLLVVMFPIDHS